MDAGISNKAYYTTFQCQLCIRMQNSNYRMLYLLTTHSCVTW